MKKKIISLIIVIFATASLVNAQNTQIKISLNEQFFDALLEAVFTHLDEPPKFPIAGNILKDGRKKESEKREENAFAFSNSFLQQIFYTNREFSIFKSQFSNDCDESIILQREIGGVKTAVKFRDGKIIVPIAFKGNYSPPLVGCVGFEGWAETNIELLFDRQKQALIGNAKVLDINLNGTGGVGGTFLARFLQSSIDKKVNPIEIIKLDKISFILPIQKSGNLRMKATNVRHKISEKNLDVFVDYKFMKAN